MADDFQLGQGPAIGDAHSKSGTGKKLLLGALIVAVCGGGGFALGMAYLNGAITFNSPIEIASSPDRRTGADDSVVAASAVSGDAFSGASADDTATQIAQIVAGQLPAIDEPDPSLAAAGTGPGPTSGEALEDIVSRAIGAPAQAAIEQPARAADASPAPVSTSLFNASPAAISNTAQCIEDLRVLSAEARVYFPSGGTTGAEEGIAQARLLGLVAQDCPGVVIQVEGHSDPSGDPAINMQLSEQRAQAVIDRVAAQGIDTSVFRAVGFGDRQPAAIRGDQPDAFYDRRVEFSVIETSAPTPVSTSPGLAPRTPPVCVTRLEESVGQTRIFYSPRSIAASQSELSNAIQLAAAAAACPEAKLRVVGQFSDEPGSGETPATARMRAIAMMSMLVAAGFEAEDIIIAAPSRPTAIPGAPGIRKTRVDFDIIAEFD